MHLTSLQTSCFFPPNAQDKILWLGTFGQIWTLEEQISLDKL